MQQAYVDKEGEQIQHIVRYLSSQGKKTMLEWSIQEGIGKMIWNQQKRIWNFYEHLERIRGRYDYSSVKFSAENEIKACIVEWMITLSCEFLKKDISSTSRKGIFQIMEEQLKKCRPEEMEIVAPEWVIEGYGVPLEKILLFSLIYLILCLQVQ